MINPNDCQCVLYRKNGNNGTLRPEFLVVKKMKFKEETCRIEKLLRL